MTAAGALPALAAAVLAAVTSFPAVADGPAEVKPGEVVVKESAYEGFACQELRSGDIRGFVIQPATAAAGRPWVWYAPAGATRPRACVTWLCRRLLEEGFHVCGTDVGDSFGSPRSRALYGGFYDHVVAAYSLAPRACLLPQSRGGLMWYNWAVENPEKVACIGGVYPVCDLTSYPGVVATARAYGMTAEELTAALDDHNPIARLAPLAKARVPILHLHGDKDDVVPLAANSGALIERYRALGGPGELLVLPGERHAETAAFFRSEKLLEFFRRHGAPHD